MEAESVTWGALVVVQCRLGRSVAGRLGGSVAAARTALQGSLTMTSKSVE